MSEHVWVQENIESYVTGGLEAGERERLEQHLAGCPECTQRLAEVGTLDRQLDGLFTQVRPRPDLEDRMIQALRARRPLRVPMFMKVATAAAAGIMLGVLGAGLNALIAQGKLPFLAVFDDSESMSDTTYGFQRARAQNNLRLLGGKPDVSTANVRTYRESEIIDGGTSTIKSADDLAREMRERSLSRLDSGGESSGKVVKTIPFSPETAVSGFVVPGTHVDVYEMHGNESKLVVEDVVVRGTGGKSGATVSLELDQEKLRKMAGANGRFEVVLRSSEDWGRKSSTRNNESGRDPKAPTTYNLERLDDVTVPGSVNQQAVTGGGSVPAAPPTTLGISAGAGAAPVISDKEAVTKAKDSGKSHGYYYYRNTAPTSGSGPAGQTSPSQAFGFAPPPPPAVKAGDVAERLAAPQAEKPAEAKPEPAKKELGAVTEQDKKPDPNEAQAVKPVKPAPAAVQQRKIIRSGDMEFEIDGFDTAVDKITKIAGEEQGYIATVNSEKLPNGKVRGTIVVRVPPDRLDTLILKLRALGELKSQKIGSEDITKKYTDMESRLKAARTMEERLLTIIKTGKGEIKDLLLAEKELGEWRTRIETIEGEVRYYNNLVSLSTLTVTLVEKEIRAPFGLTETEKVLMGIEVEDVEKAQREALAAIAEAKGRVTKSELKQLEANRLQALIQFEVTPESAGTLRDRFKQLGTMSRLDIDRTQKTEGGSGRPQDAKVKRNDVQFELSLYNLAGTSPRRTTQIDVACIDAEAAYKAILDAVKAPGRVITSNLDRQRSDQTTGTITLETREADADAMLAEVKQAGEVMRMQVIENPDAQNVTKSKRGFIVKVVALGAVQPRETADIKLLARSVPDGFKLLKDTVTKAKGRILSARLDEQDRRNITARIELDIRRDEEAGLTAALASAGDVYSRTVTRAQDAENVIDSKVRLNIDLLSVIPPRETATLGIEVTDVDKIAEVFTALVNEAKGKVEDSNINHERDGRITGSLIFTVPLQAAPALVEKFKMMGVVRSQNNARNQQVPESDLASARIVVVLSNSPLIVPRDDGLWSSIRNGLNFSFKAFSVSLMFVIIGVLFVLPWVAVIYVCYRVWLRMRAGTTTA